MLKDSTKSLFIGGPYDGKYLDIDARSVGAIHLPRLEFWGIDIDPEATFPEECPLLYAADPDSDPICFRFVADESRK